NDLVGPLTARPITLEFSGHAKPRNRLSPRGHEAANCHVVCLLRDASRGVSDDVHVIAVTHRMETWHCKTHLRPECSDHQLLPARFLHRVNDSLVLPRID